MTFQAKRHALNAGFITGYVLFGLALVSVVTVMLAMMNRQGNENRVFQQHREHLIADALRIRNVIRLCAMTYPGGDNGDTQTGDMKFPATGTGLVSDLTCPGAAPDTSTGIEKPRSIWQQTYSGNMAGTAPIQRQGLTPWKYVNRKNSSGTPEVIIFVDARSSHDPLGNSLIQAAITNVQMKPYFEIASPTTGGGQAVWRLQSFSLDR